MTENAAPGDRADAAAAPAPAPSPAERLEAFASIVNHDFRNPLNVAQGRLELARGSTAPDEHLEVVGRAHERLAALIESSVTWARSGRPPEHIEATELGSAVRRAVELAAPGEIDLEIEAGCEVQADPNRLHRLFEQLVQNAIDHGDPPVTIRVGATSEGFYVEDTGPGIPPDRRDQVFDPGYSTDVEAPGFGLAVVEGIASAHSWTVWVTEGSDGGARFEFATAPGQEDASEPSSQ